MAKVVRSKDVLVWIDCEMTGLDPEQHVLLEIATIVTDNNLQIIDEGPVLAIRQPKSELKKMDAWCVRTHTGSGLLRRVREDSVSLAEAERQTLKFLKRHCYVRTAPLCGNSIGQDRRFLVKYMPDLHKFFHYQSIDVSSVKQLVNRWYGRKYKAPAKTETHLALPDIRESITELAFYRKNVFVKPPRRK